MDASVESSRQAAAPGATRATCTSMDCPRQKASMLSHTPGFVHGTTTLTSGKRRENAIVHAHVVILPTGLDALARQKRAERGEPEGK